MTEKSTKRFQKLLLCVGAQKAGTTWLHCVLSGHSGIAFTRAKEVQYFSAAHRDSTLLPTRLTSQLQRIVNEDPNRIKRHYMNSASGAKNHDHALKSLLSPIDDDWYAGEFGENSGKDIYCADFSPEYALLPLKGYEHIKSIAETLRIIFVMRDPVERALSAIRYSFRDDLSLGRPITQSAIAERAEANYIIEMSQYEHTVKVLDGKFPPASIKYIFFEQMIRCQKRTIAEILGFCNLKEDGILINFSEKPINTSMNIEFPAFVAKHLEEKLIPTYNYIKERFDTLPHEWGK